MLALSDLPAQICGPDMPLREVLVRINGAIHHFQIVVDAQGKLLGTITDGDIRRALLKHFDFDAPAHFCMNPSPIVGHLNDHAGNLQKLQHVPLATPFLPIVDDVSCLQGVCVTDGKLEALKAALVMAGGEGRRLGQMTRNTPKPLLAVNGKSILDRLIERLEDSGVETIFISVRYLAEQIETFIRQRRSRAEIRLLLEDEPLGTGGAVSLLPHDFSHPLLVVNGDVMTNIDFRNMKAFSDRHDFDGCLAVARYQTQIPFGVIEHNKDGEFQGIREKPTQTHLVSAGIYYLNSELRALAPRGRAFDMPEILTLGANAGLRIGLFPLHEKWRDMGRPDDFVAEQGSNAEAEHE